jgi:hypothetical protein
MGRIELARGIDAIASARAAALLDPEGEALARCLEEIDGQNAPADFAAAGAPIGRPEGALT